MKFAIALLDRQIIDARDTTLHQAMLIKFPVFIAISTVPMTGVVMPLIGKTHGNTIILTSPEFLDQPVVELPRPLSRPFQASSARRTFWAAVSLVKGGNGGREVGSEDVTAA